MTSKNSKQSHVLFLSQHQQQVDNLECCFVDDKGYGAKKHLQ